MVSSTNRRRSAWEKRRSATCRAKASRVPICRARCRSSISHQVGGANSARIASATSVFVIVPSKSVRTARFTGMWDLPLRRSSASRAFSPRFEIGALLLRQPIRANPEAHQLEPRDFQVEAFRDRIYAGFEARRVLGQIPCRNRLDGETHVHDLDRMTLAGCEVHEPALGDEVHSLASRQYVFLHELAHPTFSFGHPL